MESGGGRWMTGWMDDLRFYVFSTVFQSYQDDGQMIKKSADSRWTVVSFWRKYVHEVLINRLGGLSLCG